MKFAERAKMYMALGGLVASGVLGVTGLPTVAKLPLAITVAIAGAFAVWKVENKPADPPPPAWPAGTTFPAWDQEAEPPAPPALKLVHTMPLVDAGEYRLAA